MDSRTKNAARNALFGVLSKILNLLFGICSRTIFIYVLGSTYLGINGLYSEILGLLSFAELGFGSAMTFSMYKPTAENDREKIIKLLNFYKKVYRIIAVIILILGLGLLPFLGNIVKGADWLSLKELREYFLIFLFNTFISYFVTFKYTYLNARQKNYITTNIESVVTIFSHIAKICILLIYQNFLLYLLIESMILLISRIIISRYLDKKFPILKETPEVPLSAEEKTPIYKEVRGLVVHQFSGVAVHSTDNILISMLSGLGVVAVGYISNYNMLMNSVLGFVTIIFSSVTSGFGNMVAASSTDNFRKVFKEMNFLNFWIYGFCSIAFWILIPPFITLWIGADKLIDPTSFALIILNCYLQGQSTVYNNARIAKGNFGKDKNWALAQAMTNLVVSVIAAKYFGLVGIYIGTITSRMIYVLFRPYSTYEFLFEENVKEYYITFSQYIGATFIGAILVRIFTNRILDTVTITSFLLSGLSVVLVPNLLFLVLFMRSKEFYLWRERLSRTFKVGKL